MTGDARSRQFHFKLRDSEKYGADNGFFLESKQERLYFADMRHHISDLKRDKSLDFPRTINIMSYVLYSYYKNPPITTAAKK